MSIDLGGFSDYLEVNSSPISALPMTMVCWCLHEDTAQQTLIWLGDKDDADEWHALGIRPTTKEVFAASRASGLGSSVADTTAAATQGAWEHCAAVFTSATSRASYLNGGNKGTDTVSRNPGAFDRVSLGRDGSSSPTAYLNGKIAEAAIWDVALSDAEITILSKGFSPLWVQPWNLVAYWPLLANYRDRIGNAHLSAGGSVSLLEHPPKIMYPIGQIG